jgi:hypothetical protein
MSKNANYIYPPFVMSNDINLGEGFRERPIRKRSELLFIQEMSSFIK